MWPEKYNLLIFEEIDSTNSAAIRMIKNGVRGDHLIKARRQIAGRGRHGRNWVSECGNLYLTLLLDRDLPTEILPQSSFVVSLALWATIAKLAGTVNNHLIALKWPNDVLYANKKIAGILIENIKSAQKNYLIIGLGVNIISHPINLAKPTTSLLAEGIITEEHEKVLDIFMNNFDKFFAIWQQQGFKEIREYWLKLAINLGKVITIDDGNRQVTGIFKTIDEQGAITIEFSDGTNTSFFAGEVL